MHPERMSKSSVAELDQQTSLGLSKDEAKTLFFGAPHFMLEKGKHGKAFPQAFFPWNNDLDVSDLTDRQPLSHEAFGAATLHAHLPIPNKGTWKPSVEGPQMREKWKRPMFDLGIFEVPNMLSIDGKEPGTVGLRYFLELPLAESFSSRSIQPAADKPEWDMGKMQAIEVTTALKHDNRNIKLGKHAPPQDRLTLVRGGPKAWASVGVRDITTPMIMQRLAYISDMHDQILKDGFQTSLLSKQSCAELHKHLFTEFLFPPVFNGSEADPNDLKVQTESLAKVLTTPGAWIDLSRREWRIRIGQILWEIPPHQGFEADTSDLPPDSERKWLLIQLLLAIELLLRLEAAIRLGVATQTEDFHVSSAEIHHFNKLRNDKINWDLVTARRFLDTLRVVKPETTIEHNLGTINDSHFFSALRRKRDHEGERLDSSWSCPMQPRQLKMQITALSIFAKALDWPDWTPIETRLRKELLEDQENVKTLFSTPIPSTAKEEARVFAELGIDPRLEPKGGAWIRRACVMLQTPGKGRVGGWLSRAWMMGLVLPSEATSVLLMACLLENHTNVLSKIGQVAYLHSGFTLGGRSWWSIHSIIGRVFAPTGGSQSMGWVNTPTLKLQNSEGQAIIEGWYNVCTHKMPTLREGSRIQDGPRLAVESSPLGIGHGKVLSTEFSMIDDKQVFKDRPPQIRLEAVAFKEHKENGVASRTYQAEATFDVVSQDRGRLKFTFQLWYDAYFVTAHSCRPHGHARRAEEVLGEAHSQHDATDQLPAHPLHQSYEYRVARLEDLQHSEPPDPTKPGCATWVINAADGVLDAFVRAWCSHVGRDALVARAGKACLSCSLREAKALQLGIVIRVGARVSAS